MTTKTPTPQAAPDLTAAVEARARKLYAQYLEAGGLGVLAPLDYWREFAMACPCTEDEEGEESR